MRFPLILVIGGLLCAACTGSSFAQGSIVRSIYLVDAYNRGAQEGTSFHIVLRGVHLADLDEYRYYDNGYLLRNTYEDASGVHIDWSYGSTPVGYSDTFGFTINGAAQFTGCTMYYNSGPAIDDVWQNWTSPAGTVTATITNRTAGRRYIRRTGGRVNYAVTIDDLVALPPPPPQPITIDTTPVAIDPSIPLPFSYSAYPGYTSYLMYYDQFAGGGGPGALVASFRNAAVVGLPASLSYQTNAALVDRFWWPSIPKTYNEVLSLTVTAGQGDDVIWDSITLQPSGSGDDSLGVLAIDAWLDNNDNGVVDGDDSYLGYDFYSLDDVPATIEFDYPPLIQAGQSVKALISYIMTGYGSACSTFRCTAIGATGTGLNTGGSAAIAGLPVSGPHTMLASDPVSIPAVKLQNPDNVAPTFLYDKVITSYVRATGQGSYDQIHVEEDDRTGGIALLIPSQDEPIAEVGDRISANGVVTGASAEAIVFVDCWTREPSHGNVPAPVAATGKSSGGGEFGLQQAIIDDAAAEPPVRATGLNTVGMLVRLYGEVTGAGEVNLDGSVRDVVWIDDGSALLDGLMFSSGQPSRGVAVLVPAGTPVPATGTKWAVTGVMSAIYSGSLPVRMLLPRTSADFKQF